MEALAERIAEKYGRGISMALILKWVLLVLLKLLVVIFPLLLLLMLMMMLFSPSEPSESYQTELSSAGKKAIPKQFLPIYQRAAKKYGIDWAILAGIHKVETDFSRNVRRSSVGARGHTQFMEATWAGWSYPHDEVGNLLIDIDITDPKVIQKGGGYGVDANQDGKADPMDPEDAIFATAKYLAENGGREGKIEQAVYAYNHSDAYVSKVMHYAELYSDPANETVQATGKFIFPVEGGRITSEFGSRWHPVRKMWKDHTGVDIAKEPGAPIRAVDDGVVIKSGPSVAYGWEILIRHDDTTVTQYGHMYQQSVKVQAGDRVKKGDVIAGIGNAGWSTGPHLHFEVRKKGKAVDPMPYLPK